MKKRARSERGTTDRDTMRPEYDFSKGKRGVTAVRYAEGANVVVVDPDVLDVFPDGASINQTLRALAPVIRKQRAHQSGTRRRQGPADRPDASRRGRAGERPR